MKINDEQYQISTTQIESNANFPNEKMGSIYKTKFLFILFCCILDFSYLISMNIITFLIETKN